MLVLVFACYLIVYIMRIMKSELKQIYYSNDGYWRGNTAIQDYLKHQVQKRRGRKMATETAVVQNIFTTTKIYS